MFVCVRWAAKGGRHLQVFKFGQVLFSGRFHLVQSNEHNQLYTASSLGTVTPPNPKLWNTPPPSSATRRRGVGFSGGCRSVLVAKSYDAKLGRNPAEVWGNSALRCPAFQPLLTWLFLDNC